MPLENKDSSVSGEKLRTREEIVGVISSLAGMWIGGVLSFVGGKDLDLCFPRPLLKLLGLPLEEVGTVAWPVGLFLLLVESDVRPVRLFLLLLLVLIILLFLFCWFLI